MPKPKKKKVKLSSMDESGRATGRSAGVLLVGDSSIGRALSAAAARSERRMKTGGRLSTDDAEFAIKNPHHPLLKTKKKRKKK